MSTGRRLLSNFALCIVLLFTLTVTSEASTAVRNSQVPGEYPHDNNDDNLNSQPQRHQVVDFQSLAPPTPDFIVKEKVLRARKISTRTTIAFAMLLASSSGLLNGACLSGVLSTGIGRAAGSPITSSFTNSALGLASQNPSQLLLGTKCVLSFLGGSALAGIIVPRPVPYVLQNPRNVALALVCGSVFLVAASQNVSATSTKYLYFCLAANGIQNSLTSTFTSNLCRTTHFSGIISDIGTFTGQVLRGNLNNLQKLKMLLLVAGSFWTGGALSYPLTERLSSKVFLISATIYMAVASTIFLSDHLRKETNQL